jgi:hypothetical protein
MLLLNESQIMEKSLAVQNQMTFKEFVTFNNIDLDGVMVDKIFHNINNNMPIYMDEFMIEYFGYSGIMKKQRESLVKLIETNFSEYQNQLWHSYKNKEYIEFCEKNLKPDQSGFKNLKSGRSDFKNNDENLEDQSRSSKINDKFSALYPPAPTGKSAARIKHLLIMPKLFKEMLMLAQTDKGKQVRRYYIDMMEVMELYIKFQNTVQVKSLNCQLSDIKTILLESKAESDKRQIESDKRQIEYEKQRADAKIESDKRQIEYEKNQIESEKKHDDRFDKLYGKAEETHKDLQKILPERVRISKVPLIKNHVFVILKDNADTDGFPYYALRRQNNSINSAIQKIQNDYPNVVIYFKIKHAGSIHFWNEVKFSHLKENINKLNGTNWFGLKNMTGSDFKKEIKKLDTEKLNSKE